MYDPFKLYKYDPHLKPSWWDIPLSDSETKRWQKAIEANFAVLNRVMDLVWEGPTRYGKNVTNKVSIKF